MNKHPKKKLVALLLFICCVFGGWLLLTASSAPQQKLESLNQLDSLIISSLHQFNLKRGEIEQQKVEVDSTFFRKNFTITVLPGFHETKLHLALKKTLKPYNVRLPANVLFPEKDLRINFYFKDTVVRTLLIDAEEPDGAVIGL